MTADHRKRRPPAGSRAAEGREQSPTPEPAAVETGPERAETLEDQVERLTQELAAKSTEAERNLDRYLRERAELESARISDAPRLAEMSRVLIEHGLRWRYTPQAIPECCEFQSIS